MRERRSFMAGLSGKTMIGMLEKLIEIRKFEEKSIRLYESGKIWGYLHPCIGQEAIPVGACYAIGKGDYIISNHRGHGHLIARGADIREMIKELRTAKVACQKISCPFESVPSGYSADGFISFGTTFHRVGS